MNKLSKEEHKRIVAGLQLMRNETKGIAPTRNEINSWIEGALAPERGEEVASWVANNTGYNQVWLELLTTRNANKIEQSPSESSAPSIQSVSATPVSQTFKKFLSDLSNSQIVRGALAASLVAVLVLPVILKNESALTFMDESYGLYGSAWDDVTPPDIQTRQTKGLKDILKSAVVQDYTAYHIRYGFGRFLERSTVIQKTNWNGFRSGLPVEFLNCTKNSVGQESIEQCQFAARFFSSLGEWSLMTYSVCLEPESGSSESFWVHQLLVAKQLQEDFSDVQVPIKDSDIRDFNATHMKNKDDMCKVAEKIVTGYL